MADDKDTKGSFWTTLPGILTGVAAVLTALTGLWAVAHHGSPAPPPDKAVIVDGVTRSNAPSATPAAASATNPNTAPLPTQPAATQGTVTVHARSGDTTQLILKSFQHNMTEYDLELLSGQSIPFDKIRAIDFLSVDTEERNVPIAITLVDGRTVSGALKTGYAFNGKNDLGPFIIRVENVKQITFDR